MSPRTTSTISKPGFVADHHSMELNSGRQIDWDNVAAGYVEASTGLKRIPAGTVVGEELGAGLISPRVDITNPAIGLIATDAVEDDKSAALSGYGVYVGGVVYETLLPDAAGNPRVLADPIKDELDAARCSFKYDKYEDNRSA